MNKPYFKKGSKSDLFVELAQPNADGVSRWVSVDEFVDKYSELALGNGLSWGRKESPLAASYNIETKKEGNKITKIRLNGYGGSSDVVGKQTIRSDIKEHYRKQRCVILGTSNPEVDHKNGWKNDSEVMNTKTQKMDDFQPLSKAANDAKRQFCKECRSTKIRFDAKRLGYPMSYCKGGKYHDGTKNGCEGCFWYDPVEFRRHLIMKSDKKDG